jgi:hypothetical protein
MTDKEAMLAALEALELLTGAWQTFDALDYGDNAIAALKERLADPMREVQRLGQEIEQEPVAHCKVRPLRGDESFPKVEIDWVNHPIPGPLYTSPPQRTEQEPCVHAKNPKGCYRVRCQVGDKCVDDEMSFRTTPPQPEQEPVAWQWLDTGNFRKNLPTFAEPGAWRPLYVVPMAEQQPLMEPQGRCRECLTYNGHHDGCSHATPPAQPAQRKPLTDDELTDLWYKQSLDWMEFARAIEAKIKENT